MTAEPERTGGGLVGVVSGPSGVGKTTVIARLLETEGFERSITATTRAPREGERDGVDYLFLTEDEFLRRVDEGRFLEHAVVHGNRYGTPRETVEAILARGSICILNIDVQGAESIRALGMPVGTVFLLPPSMEELERRLGFRATEPRDEVERRLEIARKEMTEADRFDLAVENHAVDDTVRAVRDYFENKRQERRRMDA